MNDCQIIKLYEDCKEFAEKLNLTLKFQDAISVYCDGILLKKVNTVENLYHFLDGYHFVSVGVSNQKSVFCNCCEYYTEQTQYCRVHCYTTGPNNTCRQHQPKEKATKRCENCAYWLLCDLKRWILNQQ